MKIEYEIGDDIELVEVEGYPGLKIPKVLKKKWHDGASQNTASVFKNKLSTVLAGGLPDDFNIGEATANDFATAINSMITGFQSQINELKKKPINDDPPPKDNATDIEALKSQLRAEFDSEYKTKEKDMQSKIALTGAKARIESQLNGIKEEAVKLMGSMIDATVDIELVDGKVFFRKKGETDKYFYTDKGEPATETDVANLIKDSFKSSFGNPKDFLNSRPGSKGGEALDWSSMTASQISDHLETVQ